MNGMYIVSIPINWLCNCVNLASRLSKEQQTYLSGRSQNLCFTVVHSCSGGAAWASHRNRFRDDDPVQAAKEGGGEEKLTVPLRSVEQLVHIVYGSMSRLPNAATVSVLCDVSAQSTSSSVHSDGQP